MANVLVTGGAGFVGSHVAEACLEAGDSVWVVDNLASGVAENVPLGAVFREGDVADAVFMRRVVEEARPAVIHHLAAQSSVTHSLAEPHLDARANILGTLGVLEAARSMDAPSRVVYAATGGRVTGIPKRRLWMRAARLPPLPITG